MIQVKICGITNKEDAFATLDAGADALGFIFYPLSKRYIEPDAAGDIIRQLPPLVTTVGVFVNEYPANIDLACRVIGINMAQLSGSEPSQDVWNITCPVIKVLHIGEDFSVEQFDFNVYGKARFLLDSADSWGGSGKTANWEICRKIAQKYNVILAGGLTPENVAEAIRQVQPAAVDVSSGVEKAPGIKDHSKIRDFISAAKNI
jgi:phosphoribosylanthranilate isomerase